MVAGQASVFGSVMIRLELQVTLDQVVVRSARQDPVNVGQLIIHVKVPGGEASFPSCPPLPRPLVAVATTPRLSPATQKHEATACVTVTCMTRIYEAPNAIATVPERRLIIDGDEGVKRTPLITSYANILLTKIILRLN